jgi:predicted transcriptional regulator
MEVHLTPDLETRLNQLSMTTGRGTNELLQEAVAQFIDHDAWIRNQVKIGIEQLERGEFVTNDEVRERMERMFHS